MKITELIQVCHSVATRDLAKLYQCTNGTKSINLAVKRNINRFPNDFYFQLTDLECENLRFQTGTSKEIHGGRRYNIYAFTEQGVAMLASVLHTKVAEQMSINIMRVFVKMRKYISNSLIEQQHYKNMLLDDHNRINLLEKSFNKLSKSIKINSIFFKGQIFDSYIVLMEIFESAKKEIIIIDDYAGKELLKLLKNINTNIIIISSKINEYDIKKYQQQYNNVQFIINDLFHDRFIIIDKDILYHCGASFKDLGKKCFAINLINDKIILNKIIKEINKKN